MALDDALVRLPRPRPAVAWTAALAVVTVWGILRLVVFQSFNFPLTYALPLLLCVWTRSGRMLWAMAGTFVANHTLRQFVFLSPAVADAPGAFWSYLATLANILVAALVVEAIIALRRRLEAAVHNAEEKRAEVFAQAARVREQAEELAAQNEELSRQAEELARIGEELNAQSEELAAQNEELRTQSEKIQRLNAELARRGDLLQTLLEATRTLRAEAAVANHLCSAALDLIGPPSVVAAVREQRDGTIAVVGAAGVPQMVALPGPVPAGASFAGVVMREDRTASLSDCSLRPDLALLEVTGERPFQSVLASPIHVAGRPVAVLEVYGHAPHEWTAEQYRLVRWLALQGSQIIETLRLQGAIRRQAALIELSPDATIVQDGEGRVSFWSRGAEALYGWKREEALGRTTVELLHTQPDPAEIRRRVLEQGRVTCELTQATREGSVVTVESRWLAQRGRDGEIEFLESNTDITERKRAEEALRRADEHKNRFLATLSHELRNPLAPIRYALQVLARNSKDSPSPADGDAAHAIEVIERQLGHLVRLVDDLLDVTRIASNKIKLQKRVVTVARIVKQAVEAAMPVIRQARHELVVSPPPDDLCVDGDAERLAQVLINLLNNAARYTPDGGVITLRSESENGEVVLSVSDTGIGLRAEDVPSLFQMFSQVGDSGRGGGLGIGLALVKGVVELHGGHVEARSAGVGLGSTFLVRLPAAREAPAPRPEAPQITVASARRVLVVDDNPDTALMMKALLELDGHEVFVAHDGTSALRMAHELLPQAVLLDIGLPSMDGYEVARGLRLDPRTSQAFLVAVTGWGQEEDRRRAREHGFDAHLTKPADPEHIRRLVASAGGAAETKMDAG